ncbi:MAG: AgmX/PglI C-terminal domain-containing protein, partial [Kofleriaceae bacterium]|nr:AgmX/PglI C-terminal domain-containing protein [Kofleriaceae bacterium]
ADKAVTPAPALAAAAPPSSPPGASTPAHRKVATRQDREALLRAIRGAYQHRLAATSPTTSPSAPSAGSADDSDDLDKEYVRTAMGGIMPLVVDCYQQARKTQPELAGTLVVNFTIEAEPDIGGLVTESAIDPEQSQIQDPGLGECVQDAIFALELDPPTNGGTVKVTYPFTFSPRIIRAVGGTVRNEGSAKQ